MPALEEIYPVLTGQRKKAGIIRYSTRSMTEADEEDEDLHTAIRAYSVVPPEPQTFQQILYDLIPYEPVI